LVARIVVAQPLLLGQAIKQARLACHMTQVELAEAVGTYPRAIVEVERGRSKADMQFVIAVLDAVGLTLVVESS
jgi:DNA-binding XRE family transcriptional regulator